MKNFKIIFIFATIMLSSTQAFSQILPPDPGQGSPVPLDGGLLLALLAVGGATASLFSKKKNKDK